MIFKRAYFAIGKNVSTLIKTQFLSCEILPATHRLFKSISSFTWRTHTCGELRSFHEGQEVVLCGWSSFRRCDRFLVLRDSYGQTQIVFEDNDSSKNYALSLPLESVIQVKGIARKRPVKDVNKRMVTGEMEVLADDVKVLSISKSKLPMSSKDYNKVGDVTKFKYRYLALRIPELQHHLKLRSRVLMKIREFLHDKHGFIDIETPTLFKRTPGGAKEFIVPTKFPGSFYSLVQSPQQFKQMLMVASLDRYFQIARCYRNEGTKSDRQPEFTQVDIEASFTTAEDIQCLVEQLLQYSWPEETAKFSVPFHRIKYSEAIRFYGTDKPDLRYDIKLQDLTSVVKSLDLEIFSEAKNCEEFIIFSIVVPRGSRHIKGEKIKEINKEAEMHNLKNPLLIHIKQQLKWDSAVTKHIHADIQQKINEDLCLKPDDLIICSAGRQDQVTSFLGKVRTACAKHLRHLGVVELNWKDDFQFLWVTDFPMFLRNKEGNWESAHHPFTAPHPDDIDLIYTHPEKARSQHYDLVLNGQEIAGGSIRIHDSKIQRYVLEEILKEDVSSLQHLLDALSSGCPPHGGIALGIDRIMAIMCECQSIADVIAFPKSLDGKDLMSGCPSPISEDDKLMYHIEPTLKTI